MGNSPQINLCTRVFEFNLQSYLIYFFLVLFFVCFCFDKDKNKRLSLSCTGKDLSALSTLTTWVVYLQSLCSFASKDCCAKTVAKVLKKISIHDAPCCCYLRGKQFPLTRVAVELEGGQEKNAAGNAAFLSATQPHLFKIP